jgi:predicted metalloenzyme YecM
MGDILCETEIAWRNISVFKLANPIRYQNRKISLVELPAPKKGSDYKTWFEHVEFVINKNLEDFIAENSELDFNTESIWKETNPTISLNFWDISVKFHKKSLESVIIWEQN